ncbi:MAG: tetratricopeptide repeat protein [Planctomycetaceae bacterium]|nr:tetratricopeptide repeat protein [Planctomycetaceae bacterium]
MTATTSRQYRFHTTGASSGGIFLQGVLIAALAVAVYLPALQGGFVWDDDYFVPIRADGVHNRMLLAGDGLRDFWFSAKAVDYWPLTFTAFWVQWRLWGADPAGYHAVNILLHAVAALLVWRLLLRLRVGGAFLAAALFAVHPVCTASVAWISELKNTLSLVPFLLAAWAYARFLQEGRKRWYALALALFLTSLLAKTGGVMLPIVLLGMAWALRGRLRLRDALQTAPFFFLALAMGAATIWFDHNNAAGGAAVRQAGMAERVATAGWALWFYLYKTFLPVKLAMIYPAWRVDPGVWYHWLPLVSLIIAFVACWRWRATWPGRTCLLGLGFFVVNLLPAVGLVDTSFMMFSVVSDHFYYVSLLGPLVAVAALAEHYTRPFGAARRWGWAAAGIILAVLGGLTWQRADAFGNQETLWRDNIAKYSDVPGAHHCLGNALLGQNRCDEAIIEFQTAMQLKSGYQESMNSLGVALGMQRKYDQSIPLFQEAIRLGQGRAVSARNNLGLALTAMGRFDEAIQQQQLALAAQPDWGKAHNDLAAALLGARRFDEAARSCRESLRLQPQNPKAHMNLGLALNGMKQYGDAIDEFRCALAAAKGLWQAQEGWAEALEALGQPAAAAERLENAISLQPGNPVLLNRLAWLLATREPGPGIDPVRAVAAAQEACRITSGQVPTVLDTLAAAYAAAGRFDEAVSTAQRAQEAAATRSESELAQQIQKRLALYRQHRPYRQ